MSMDFSGINRVALWVVDCVLLRRLFSILEHIGVHLTLNHFYQPIPDTRMIDDKLLSRRSQLVGINMNEPKQNELLNQFVKYKKEYDLLPRNKAEKPWQYYVNNPNFGPVDAEVLYCMIRSFKPKKVIEIGCGYSTYLSALAILKNGDENGCRADLIAIEPYANKVLKAGFPGLTRLIQKKVQDIDLMEYEALSENDILFIDSSHVLKIGSDVQHAYLEILPRLNKGVIVHIHDVFFPCEYPKNWVLQMHRFWNEQYLVQAFLAFNKAFEIEWCGSYMHLMHSDKLEEAFSSYDPKTVWSNQRPGATSLWLRKVE